MILFHFTPNKPNMPNMLLTFCVIYVLLSLFLLMGFLLIYLLEKYEHHILGYNYHDGSLPV